MSSYRKHQNTVARIGILFALSLGLAACDGTQQEAAQLQPGGSASEVPLELQLPGLPEFHKPLHARSGTSEESMARLSEGYHYAQGAFNNEMQYGIYTYLSDTSSYTSTSIWGRDGSSLSSGMELVSSGESWLQAGSYMVDPDGAASGEYATTYVDAGGRATLYLTDFRSSPVESIYRSVIDHSNTSASPDCFYDSEWRNNSSISNQQCNRDDGSMWSCAYTYDYEELLGEGGTSDAVRYTSTQSCDDSRTEIQPDYRYESTMTWFYLSGTYSDSTRITCLGLDDLEHSYTYVSSEGSSLWIDENGQSVASPLCAWNSAQVGY